MGEDEKRGIGGEGWEVYTQEVEITLGCTIFPLRNEDTQ